MSPEKGGEEKKNTHCTEKQLQMVLHPSSLCHKPNCTAPHHTAPPPLTQPTPEARLTHLVLPGWTVFFLRHSRCVYRFITASPVSAQSTPAPHTACLNFFFLPVVPLLPAYRSSYLPRCFWLANFFFPDTKWLALDISCYLLGVNHGGQRENKLFVFVTFVFFLACDSLHVFLTRVTAPEQVQSLQQSKNVYVAARTARTVLCCCCSRKIKAAVYFTSLPQISRFDGYAILMTFQLHSCTFSP